jgi:hypothetical protein
MRAASTNIYWKRRPSLHTLIVVYTRQERAYTVNQGRRMAVRPFFLTVPNPLASPAVRQIAGAGFQRDLGRVSCRFERLKSLSLTLANAEISAK